MCTCTWPVVAHLVQEAMCRVWRRLSSATISQRNKLGSLGSEYGFSSYAIRVPNVQAYSVGFLQ